MDFGDFWGREPGETRADDEGVERVSMKWSRDFDATDGLFTPVVAGQQWHDEVTTHGSRLKARPACRAKTCCRRSISRCAAWRITRALYRRGVQGRSFDGGALTGGAASNNFSAARECGTIELYKEEMPQ